MSRTYPHLSRAGRWLLAITAANAGQAVYGALLIGVLLAAEDPRGVGYSGTIEAAAVLLALYWLTGLYTHSLSMRIRAREPLNRQILWRSCVHELPLVEGAVIPFLTLFVARAAGIAVGSGVKLALWTTVGVVIVLEAVAGWRSRGRQRLWLEAIAGAAMGLVLIALQLVLH